MTTNQDQCTHCRVELPAPRHGPDCPETTGLYPVGTDMLDAGARCGECGDTFAAGSMFMRAKPTAAERELVALVQDSEPDQVVMAICLACATTARHREPAR